MSAAIIGALAPVLIKSGADILTRIVRSKFGDGPAKVVEAVADVVGTAATPEAIVEAHRQNPQAVETAIKAVEEDRMDEWAKIIAIERDIVAIQHATIREELGAKGLMSRTWRPFVGFVFGVSGGLVIITVCILLLKGDVDTLVASKDLWALIGSTLATLGTVTGFYVQARSKEKQSGAA